MANEQSGSPLRRWRTFYGAFGAIDDAIEEAAGHPRAAFLDARARIVRLLRGAEDDGVAEQLCAALDGAMAEALQTLRVAPVPHGALASTGLARAVGALRGHGSPRIRRLAGDVVRGWTAAIDGYVATAAAAKQELDKLSGDRFPRQRSLVPAAAAAAVEVHKKKNLPMPSAKMFPGATAVATEERKKRLCALPRKPLLTAATASGRQNTSEELRKSVTTRTQKMQANKSVIAQRKKPIVAQVEKMEATKRKLREGHQEAERNKRQHTIQNIN